MKWTKPNLGSHLPALDGVRGLAFLAVFFFHASAHGRPILDRPAGQLYQVLANAGWSGVDLFFVLSGFLITGILLDTKGDSASGFFRTFYMRRVLRIFPLYYACLLIAFVIWPVLGGPSTSLRRQAFYWLYLENVLFALRGFETESLVGLIHFWSLAIEEQFYVLWPLVVFLTPTKRLLGVCLFLVGLSVGARPLLLHLGVSYTGVYVLTVTRLDGLALGALIATALRLPGGFERVLGVAKIVFPIAVTALLVIFAAERGLSFVDPVVIDYGYLSISLAFAALLVLVIGAPPESWLAKVFCFGALRGLGRVSYGAYVFHLPVILALEPLWPDGRGRGLIGHLLFAAAAFAVTLVISVLSWKLFEAPILRLKERWRLPRAAKERWHEDPP